MSYLKVIDNGHIIEVYEMEREPNHIDKVKDFDDGYDALNTYHLFDDEELLKERNRELYRHDLTDRIHKELDGFDRRHERRAQTVRDAKANLKRLAVRNFNSKHIFVTLTYAENFQDVEEADKHFSNFIKDLRIEMDYDFHYIAVREFQKRGAIHYHVMMDMWLNISKEWEIRIWEKEFGKIWGHGFVDIQNMNRHQSKDKRYKDKAVDNVGAYLSKYFSKSADDERLSGKKLYLCSKGLQKPKILKNADAIEFLKENKMWEKKEVFTNSYESEYLGKISYKEYNLEREEKPSELKKAE